MAHFTGGPSSVELNAGNASMSGPTANIMGSVVKIGGQVHMGFGQQTQPAIPTVVSPVIIDPWKDWRATHEKAPKDFSPTKQVVSDEDSPK